MLCKTRIHLVTDDILYDQAYFTTQVPDTTVRRVRHESYTNDTSAI